MCFLRDVTPNRLSHSDVSFTWRYSQSAVTFWCALYVTSFPIGCYILMCLMWRDSQSAFTFWCLFYVTWFPIGYHILMYLLHDVILIGCHILMFLVRDVILNRLSHSDVFFTWRDFQSAVTFWCVFYVTWLTIGCHILICLSCDVISNRLSLSDMSCTWRDSQSAATFTLPERLSAVTVISVYSAGTDATAEIISSKLDFSHTPHLE